MITRVLDAHGAIRRRAFLQDKSILRPTKAFTAAGNSKRLPYSHLVFQLTQGSQVRQRQYRTDIPDQNCPELGHRWRTLGPELVEPQRWGVAADCARHRTRFGYRRGAVAGWSVLLSLVHPGILFLSEPTSALDPQSTALVEDTISSELRSPENELKAIVWITHSEEQGRRVGTRFLRISSNGCEEETELLDP